MSESELYGLKIGDRVTYIGKDLKKEYPTRFMEKMQASSGIVTDIVPRNGEFHVTLTEINSRISLQRQHLILEDDKRLSEEFDGQIISSKNISTSQMRYHLTNYHELIEGEDFGIFDANNKKQVILTNEKFVNLIKDLTTMQKVSSELAEEEMQDITNSLSLSINSDRSTTSSFFASNWFFQTHLTPFKIQCALYSQYGLDPEKDLGYRLSR